MAPRTRVAELDQALFGYRDGHRLLAATGDLAPEDRSLLVRQTDHPDAGRARQWGSLLAGCPLPSGRYAISLTWPAREMPRPGCVWTHTLLLNAHALATCESSELLRLFRRPAGPDPDLAGYTTPLSAGALEPVRAAPLSGRARAWGSTLMWALYDAPERPVRAAGVDLQDADRHQVLLAVWSAAWPTLRGCLSFIDAPHSARQLPDRRYDLQLHEGSRVAQEDPGERVVRGVPKVSPPPWATRLLAEAVAPDGFAAFLRTYDGDLGSDRSVLPSLHDVYELGVSRDAREASTRELMAKLAATYPDPGEAQRLKRDVVGYGEAASWASPISEPVRLMALLNSSGYGSFDVGDLEIENRARSLLVARRADLARVLGSIENPRQPLASRFLASLAEGIDSEIAGALAKHAPAALISLVGYEPALAHDSRIWAILPPRDLWMAVASQRGAKQRRNTLAAIIIAGAAVDPKVVADAWGNASSLVLSALAEIKPSQDVVSIWLTVVDVKEISQSVSRSEFPSQILAPALAKLSPPELAKLAPDVVLEALSASPPEDLVVACLLAAREASLRPGWASVAMAAYEQSYARLASNSRRKTLAKALGPKKGTTNKELRVMLAGHVSHDMLRARQSARAVFLLTDREAFRALMDVDGKAVLAKEALAASRADGVAAKKWQLELVNRTIADHADRDSVFRILQDLSRALNPF
jgi:hypothetical protein